MEDVHTTSDLIVALEAISKRIGGLKIIVEILGGEAQSASEQAE